MVLEPRVNSHTSETVLGGMGVEGLFGLFINLPMGRGAFVRVFFPRTQTRTIYRSEPFLLRLLADMDGRPSPNLWMRALTGWMGSFRVLYSFTYMPEIVAQKYYAGK